MSSVPLPLLSSVIAWIESRGEIYALRFEPSIYAGSRFVDYKLLQIIQTCNNCDENTARVIASTSWGAFQVMGFNLYNMPINYRGNIASFLCDSIRQIKTFNDYIESRGIDYTVSDLASSQNRREHFALLYNGAISYAENIVQSLQHFGVSVTP